MEVIRLASTVESPSETKHGHGKVARLLIAICVLLCSLTVSAATKTSTTTGGAWNATGTWVGGVLPVAGDDVIIADGATVTVPAAVGSIASLTVGQGASGILSFNNAAGTITVTGTTTVNAGAQLNTTVTAARTFANLVVNGTWNATGAMAFTITGNITVNTGATFTAGTGVYTLNTAGQSIGGTIPALSIANLTINSPGTCANNIPTLNIGTALAGTGSLTLAANTTLSLGGSCSITTLNGTTNTPTTVTYTGASPAVKGTGATYYNLVMANTGTATAGSAVAVTNNLTINAGSIFATSTMALSTPVTNVSGTLSINGATAAKALGTVTINSGGAINSTAAATITATSLSISAGGSWSTAAAAAAVTISGDLTNAGTFSNTVATTYVLAGNITNDGTFTSGTGTYTLTGAAKTINTTTGAPLSINTVLINGTGTYTVSSAYVSPNIFSIPTALTISAAANTLTVNGYMTTPSITFSTGGTLTNNDTVSVATTLTGGSGTFVNAATGTLYFGGTSIASALTLSSTGNTVVYNGAGAQTIRSSINYYNLAVANTGAGTATMNAVTNVRNNISVLSGTLCDGGFQIAGNATGTISVAAGATFEMGALTAAATTSNWPTLFTTANTQLSPTSTVVYNTNSAITISTVPAMFGHLTLSGSGIKTAGAAHIVQGNLSIAGGALADAGFTVTVNGNVTNGSSHTGTGRIYLSGGSAAHTLSGTGSYTNLELDDALGANMNSSFTVGGTLTLNSGTYAVGAFALTLNGPAIAGTGINLATTTASSLVFGGTNANPGLYIPSSVSNLAALTVAIATTNTLTINSDIVLNATGTCLTLTTGRTDIGSHDLTLTGTISGTGSATNCIIADGAAGGQVLKIFPAATNTTFTFPIADNTGTLEYAPVAFTSFNPTGGTKTIGVNVTDAAHPQVNSNQVQTNYISRYWTFSESGPAISYTYATMAMTYLAADDIGTVSTANDQINRYDGSWSTINSTVTTTSATTTTANSNVSGPLGGNDYTVRLNTATVYTWNNTAGGLWTTPGNWTPTRSTPASSDVLIFDGSVTPGTITVTAVPTQTVAQLQVINGVDVSLQAGATATILTTGFAANSNALTVDAASALRLTSTNTFTLAFPALSTLSTSLAGVMSINASNTLNFTNLLAANNTISGAITNNGGTVTSTAATTTFGAGSFYTHNMNAGAIPGATWSATSTLTVSGVTTTNPTGISGTFGHFIWNNPSQTAVTAINGALIIAGDMTVSAGNVNFGALNVSVTGSLTNNGTINTSTAGATLTMNGSSPSTISGSGIWTTGTTGRLLNLVVNNAAGVTLTPALALQSSLALTSGTLTAGALTIGVPATNFTLTRAAGSLANVPAFNYTSGAYAITYSGASTSYTVLNELPPATTPTNGVLTVSPATATVILDKDAAIGTLTTSVAGATFDLNGKTLGLSLTTAVSNTGTITANAATSTLKLNGSVAQTLTTNTGTYTGGLISNLIIDNSNASGAALGTQSGTLGFGNVTINSTRLFNLATFAIRIAGAYTNNGTITANGTGASITLNGTSPQSFNIGTYTGSLLSNFTVNNTSGVTLTGPLNVSTLFTLTNGLLTTTNTNLLTLTATTVGGLVGGTTANYINGPFARTLPASLVSGSTYTFPVGKSGYNLFELVNPTTSSTGTVVVKVEAQDAPSGGIDGPGFNGTGATRFWQTALSGAGAFTSTGTIRLYDATVTMTGTKVIGNASTPTGIYNTIGNSAINTPLTGNIASASPAITTLGCFEIGDKSCLAGHYTIGATGADFTSLNQAINTVNASNVCADLLFELTSTYTGTETFPLTLNAPLYTGGPWNITFRPAAGVSAVTSGNPGSGVNFLALNGADYVTFDGRAGGVGTTPSWIIRNTQTAATYTPTFQFANDATNDTLEYMQIESQNALATSGTVYIGLAATTGNDNILIDHNIIRDRSDATGYPLNAIYATGTALKMNDNITISNNRIFNFWAASAATNGISIQANNSDYTIAGNSIYQTASRTQTAAAAHTGITISSTAGNNFKVTDNYIGGTAVNAGGTAWTVGGAFANTFIGINMSVGGTTASSVQNNTITNMNWSCTGTSAVYPGIFTGIDVTNGAVSIGDVMANTIGSASATGAISITSGTAGGNSYGIVNTSTSGPIVISNNNIGGINVMGTSTSVSHNFTAMIFAGGNTSKMISGNTIGSTSVANSINASTASSSTTPQSVIGMAFTSGVGGTLYAQNNTIANLNNSYTGTGASVTAGILISNLGNAGSFTGNQVYNLNTAATNTGTGMAATLTGIGFSSSTTGHTISGNTIYGLSSSAASAAITANGIYYAPATGGTNVIDANLIHSISAGSSAGIVNGLVVNAGSATVSNNMIRLGINAAGSSVSANVQYNGINDVATTNNIWFNSVYIGGSVTSGAANTYAYYGAVSSGTRAVQDNIFLNARTNSGGTGKHYAIRIGAITGLTCNYNDLLSSTTLGATGATDYPGISAWRSQTGTPDINSVSDDPKFINATGDATAVNLHISPSTPTQIEATGIAIASVTTDYDGQMRASYTPTDMGADADNFIPIDLTAPVISAIALGGTCSGQNIYTVTGISIADASGVDVSTANKPRLYYKKSTSANTLAGWSYVQASNAASPFSFDIDLAAIGGVGPGEVVQYFVVAQDLAPAANLAISNSNTFNAAPAGVSLGASAFPIGGTLQSFTILPCQGTVSVGTGQAYGGLTPAGGIFQAINALPAGLTGDLTISITSDIAIEDGANPLTNARLNGYKVRIVPSATTLRTISNNGNLTVPMIPFNGAIGVTIDGSFSGSGRYLRFRNTHPTAGSDQPVLQYYGSASLDTLANVVVESNESNVSSAMVVIGSGTNTGIVITGNILTSATGGTTGNAANGIFSNTSTNSSCFIIGNNFENTTNSAILLGSSNGNSWTISQNNIYQSAASTLAQTAISVLAGNSHTIRANKIGGSAAGCTGTWVNSGNVTVNGISIALPATGATTVIDSNIIQNISLTGTTTAIFNGITATTGLYSIGTTYGNSINNIATAGTGSTTGISASAGASTATISGNSVFALTNTNAAATTVRGIFQNGTSASTLVSKNLVYNLTGSASTASIVIGIEMSGQGVVANNMVRLGYNAAGGDITNTSIISGILKDAAVSASFYHNSVYIGGSGVGTTANNTYAFRRTSTGSDDIRDNIFVNARSNASTGGIHYAFVLNAITTITSNYNIFYAPNTGGALFSLNTGTTAINTLQSWNVNSSNLDINSGVGDPDFVSAVSATPDLHIGSPSPAEGAGTLIATISDDIDGDSRASNTPVDIGADAANDAPTDIYRPVISVSGLTSLSTACGGGVSATVSATITDAGSGATAATLWYRRSSPSATAWSYFTGTLTAGSGSSGTWSFPVSIPTAVNGEIYQFYFVATDAASNLGYQPYDATSPLHTSVTVQVTPPTSPYSVPTSLGAPLSGTVTVGSGGTYPTFNGASGLFSAINSNGLSSNLTVTVISDITETTTTPLNQISAPCGGGPYAVLIQPDGTTKRTITGAISGSVGLISFNGADSVTIDGQNAGDGQQHLHFKNTSSNYSGTGYNATFYWYNDATHNTITNTIVEGLSKAQSSGVITGGVVMLGTGSSAGNSYNTFSNNMITGTYSGGGADAATCLLFSQGSAGAPNGNNQILNNSFKDFSTWSSQMVDNYYGATNNRCYGLHINSTGNGSNWTITGNSFYTTFPENHGTFTALSFQPGAASTGNTISGNYIGGSAPQCGMGAGAFKVMGSTYNYSSAGLIGYTETRYEGIIVNAGAATINNNSIKRIWIRNLYYSGFVGIDIQGSTSATANGNIFGGTYPSAYTDNFNTVGSDIIEVDGGGGTAGASGYIYGIWVQNSASLRADSNTFNYLIQNGDGTDGGQVKCIWHQGSGFNITNNVNSTVHQEAFGLLWNSYAVHIAPSSSSSGNRIDNNKFSTVMINDGNTSQVRSSSIYVNIANGLTVSGSIQGNQIYDNGNVENSGYVDGIYLYGNASGAGTWDINNNMIYLSNPTLNTRESMTGINLQLNSGFTTRTYYNTVWIAGSSNTNTGVSNHCFAFFRSPVTGTDVCTVKNNIFINTRTGGNTTTYFGAIANNTSATGWTSDYNFLMDNSGSSRNIIGYFNGTAYTRFSGTTPNWQATTGQDANGRTATYSASITNFSTTTLKPADLFTNTSIGDMHIAYTNGTSAYQFVDARATPLSILVDYDGETRDASTPDIGADEFNTCSRIAITAQPSAQTACAGSVIKIGVKNSGATPYTYQWQVSIDHGTTWLPLSIVAPYTTNAVGDTLIITGLTAGLDSLLYRVDVSNLCGDSVSASALLHVNPAPQVTWETPASHLNNVCSGSITLFGVKGQNATAFQWQVSADAGATWTNVVNAVPYSTTQYADTSYLSITTQASLDSNIYRCIVSNTCGRDTSSYGTLIVQSAPVDTLAPGKLSLCAGSSGVLRTGGTGVSAWSWQYNDGSAWVAVSNGMPAGISYANANSSSLQITTGGSTAGGYYQYRAQLSSLCGTTYSDTATLNVMNGNSNAALATVSDSLLMETCPDGGWTYYSTYSQPNKWLFAIKKNGNTLDATPRLSMHFTTPVGYDSVENPSAQKALFTMNRHWNVTINAGSIDSNTSPVSVRFFYDPADTLAMMHAARAWALAHPSTSSGLTTAAHSVEWFKTRGIQYLPANNTPSSVPTSYTFAQASYSYGVMNGVNYVELKNITSFSGGTAAIRVAPTAGAPLALPVKLLYLTATPVENRYIRLDWATASEMDNKGFYLERSTDGISFASIGWIDGHGNSNATIIYTRPDQNVKPDVVYYYRLQQVDYDGHTTYSEIVSASIRGAGIIIGEPVPNPASDATRINVYSSDDQAAYITMYNATGQQIRAVQQHIYSGANFVEMAISDLASGIYFVNINIADQHTTRRLIVR